MERLGRWELVMPLGRYGSFTWFEAVPIGGKPYRGISAERAVLQCYTLDDPWSVHMADEDWPFSLLCDHPSIIKAIQLGSEQRIAWVAIERFEGYSLRRLLRLVGALPAAGAAAIGRQLSEAAAHVHGLRTKDGIPLRATHGHLSLDTVWLDPAGRVVILNPFLFVPHALEDVRGPESLDTLAPARLRGDGRDVPSELFEIAAITCALATGISPFLRASTIETFRAGADVDLSAVEGELARVQPVLREVLLRTLDRNPSRRPPDARELAFCFYLAQVAGAASGWAAQISDVVERASAQERPVVCGVHARAFG